MTEQQQLYGEGVPFQRLRRVTGYLTSDIKYWNNGKLAELKDREKHEINKEEQSIISERCEIVRYSGPGNIRTR